MSPGAAFDPFPLFPLPPPLLLDPPFPPVLDWEAPGELPPDGADPFPWLSLLDERFSGCLPSVRGGGGFRDTWLEPFPFPGIFVPPSPDLAPANPESPTGFWPEGAAKVLLFPLGPEEPSLELVGREELVLAPNAAQPVRPLPEEEELLLVGLADVVDAFISVLLNAWKVLAVSGLDLMSAFFTKVSFTTGADEAEAGDGFCGGFWAIRFICLVQRAQYHTSRGSLTSLSVT